MYNINLSYCPQEKYCYIYNPDNTTLTYTNDVVLFNYIRKEIAKNRLDGYVLEYNGNKYNISNTGEVNYTDNKLFQLHNDLEYDIYSYTSDIFENQNNPVIDYCVGRDVDFECVMLKDVL